jgi:hypothetical protein
LQVAATPCDAWRVSRILPTWRDSTEYGDNFNDQNTGKINTVTVRLLDLSAPHQLYVPAYGGQIYIFIGIFCAAFVGAGMIGLLLSWGVILWNVRIAAGKDAPWWAYTANRSVLSSPQENSFTVACLAIWLLERAFQGTPTAT